MCILDLPNKGFLVVEAMAENTKARLHDAGKPFKGYPIVSAATDEHLVCIDEDFNACQWSLSRNPRGSRELEGSGTILHRCKKFSGKAKLVAQTNKKNRMIITICTKAGEARQFDLPVPV